jgi:hypothetical protein
VIKAAARPKIQCEVDIAFVIDRTGSSQKFQTGIPLTAEIVLKQVAAKARSVRCWVQSHGDLDMGEQPVLHSDASSPEQAMADIKSIAYSGGGDPPEHHVDAIENVLNSVPWASDRNRARGAILAILNADTKPARSGVTARALGEEIRQRGILLYLVCEPTPMLAELVDGAGGLIFEISNNPDPADLQKVAGQLAASIVATVSKGAAAPVLVPVAPANQA